jgi:Protein of unknown function (DUF3592)
MGSPHVIESELNGPTPRAVRFREGWGAGCAIWFVRLFILPHTIAGVFILVMAVRSTGLYLGVWLYGTEYQGQIVKKYERPGSKGRISHIVEFEYMVNGGLHTATESVDVDVYRQAAEGDRIDIRAMESVPESEPWTRITGRSPLLSVAGKWGIALFWNGILSLFVWALYVRPWQMRRLVRWGRPTEGIVRSATLSTNKKTKTYRFIYEYAVVGDDVLQPTVFKRRMSSTQNGVAGIRSGDLVTILYDPRKPKRSVIYRASVYRAI